MFFQEYSMQNSRTIRNSSCSLQQNCPLNHGTAPAAYHGVFASIAFNCKLKNYYCNHGTNKGLLRLHDTTWCLLIMRLKLQYISLIICYNTKSYLIEFQSNLIDILKNSSCMLHLGRISFIVTLSSSFQRLIWFEHVYLNLVLA